MYIYLNKTRKVKSKNSGCTYSEDLLFIERLIWVIWFIISDTSNYQYAACLQTWKE